MRRRRNYADVSGLKKAPSNVGFLGTPRAGPDPESIVAIIGGLLAALVALKILDSANAFILSLAR